MKLCSDSKILIVGLGLIGGSYAQGLSAKGYEVGGIAKSAETVAYALGKGYISSGYTEVNKEYVGKFDVVIFALYPKVFLSWLEKYGSYIKRGAYVTDVTGVKTSVVYKAREILRGRAEFIGAHPMAGKEVYGIKNADYKIFRGANYIVTPTADNTEDAKEICADIGRALGFKRISFLSPEEHDEMIGFLSQLAHMIAVALMDCKESKHLVDYTGNSFRDLTRIADINEDMWTELFLLNKDELIKQTDLFSEKLKELRDALAEEDAEKMKEMMRLSSKRRRYFNVKPKEEKIE